MSVPHDPAAASALHGLLTQASAVAPPLTPRQAALTHLLHYYRARNYDARKVAWDGSMALLGPDRETVAAEEFIPPGFVAVGGESKPLRLRRPDAPYYLARVVVNRFTGLLFSQKKKPRVTVDGDTDSDALLQEALKVGRFWHAAMRWRTLGGAMGTGGIGFKFTSDGRPVFEVFDPRWCTPTWAEESTGDVSTLEIRYAYSRSDAVGGERWFWYRRLIDDKRDRVWIDVPCIRTNTSAAEAKFEEPQWETIPCASTTEHGFGFAPVRWVQNIPVDDAVDGESDCHGAYELMEEFDTLTSQANRGTVANCDPTVVLSTDAGFDEVKKGSDNALKLEKGDSAEYLEINGAGIEAAFKAADRCEERALRVCECVIDQARSATSKTATEVDRDYSSMFAKADVLRGQYGEGGVAPLLALFLRACAQRLAASLPVLLPPRCISLTSGQAYVPHKLGSSRAVSLQWPEYVEPTAQDINLAVTSASTAFAAGLVDRVTAVKFIARYFAIENPAELAARIESEKTRELSEDPYARFVGGRASVPVAATSDDPDESEEPPQAPAPFAALRPRGEALGEDFLAGGTP